jgi:hypothetical protein
MPRYTSHFILSCTRSGTIRICQPPNQDLFSLVANKLYLQVVRVYDMKGDLANTKPSLTRVPLKETPLRAMFWGGLDSIAVCTAGLGQVANLFTVKGVYHGRAAPTPQKVAERLHDASEVTKSCSVPTSPGGMALLATLTKTKEAKVTDGDGKLLATVQPSGINNYQVRCNTMHHTDSAYNMHNNRFDGIGTPAHVIEPAIFGIALLCVLQLVWRFSLLGDRWPID